MSISTYLVVMLLWWGAVGITMRTRIGMSHEYSPGTNVLFMALTTPANFGSWLLPLYELIWGGLHWWQIAGGVGAGLISASWVPRIVLSRPAGILFSNPLAAIFSIVGTVVLIASLWQ